MILIGVEAGSSTVRATAFDERGTIVAAAARALTSSSPRAGWVELDQDAVFAAVGQAIQELKPKFAETPELLCLTAPTDGLWLVDRAGEAVRPAILPADRRSIVYREEWSANAIAQAVYRRAGYALDRKSVV